jgi:SagB-type dehydrogenase family enzyme
MDRTAVIAAFVFVWIPMALIAAGAAEVKLPPPSHDGRVSVEKALTERKTARKYSPDPLSLKTIAQLCWAANGNRDVDTISQATLKVIPSAMAVYPLNVLVISGSGTVNGLEPGVYRYDPARHQLDTITKGDQRKSITDACFNQDWIGRAPAVFVITGAPKKTKTMTDRFGVDFAVMEAGNSGQNILMQASALGLKTNSVAGFSHADLSRTLGLSKDIRPLLMVTVGK